MIIVRILILAGSVCIVFACMAGQPPGTNTLVYLNNGNEDPRFKGNLSDPALWDNAWSPPPNDPAAPGNYDPLIKQLINDQKNQQSMGSDSMFPSDAGSDWPAHWIGLGEGLDGQAPPPWAFVPGASGKSGLCFQNPSIGKCVPPIMPLYQLRWGFNPYSNDCVEFVYSGCQGNDNNFFNKKRCREACLGSPKSNCVTNKNVSMSDYHQWRGPNIPLVSVTTAVSSPSTSSSSPSPRPAPGR